jgi:hypothetical protein
MAAIAGLPTGIGDLQAIVEDAAQPSRFRVLAATLLWRLGSRTAQQALAPSTGERDEQILSAVLIALGRIGDERALALVIRAAGHATGAAAKQARFARMLIEHRLGAATGETVALDQPPLAPRGTSARPFELLRPSPAELASALRSLAREPFGIDYAPRGHQIRCGRRVWMLLFNAEWVDHPRSLIERKWLAGVVASRSDENRDYSVRFLILTSPAGAGRVRIGGLTTLGDPVFSGDALVGGDATEFSVTALSRPGAFPFRLEATWLADRLDVRHAATGVFVEAPRRPTPGARPG